MKTFNIDSEEVYYNSLSTLGLDGFIVKNIRFLAGQDGALFIE